ncbi:MAG TPA: DNA translocase FtsK [Cerasibacillus sp.]|uniref:FtsK/SpoIIIE family DNA translocase n=1 Tax=Cerasibacillus sp. TaxID=2498711 RepID=UPI002F3F486B
MARKGKRKRKKLKQKVKFELLGLLFIFLAIFGSGASAISDGIIPGGLDYIFRFFLGIWYFVASVFLLITGVILLVKRKYPDFTHKKMIGFYILFAGILLLTHIYTLEQVDVLGQDISIIKASWNLYITYVNGHGSSLQVGGGMVGALISAFCYYLFSSIGTKIVALFAMVVGLIFLTELSVGDVTKKIYQQCLRLIGFFKNKWVTYQAQKTDHTIENVESDDLVQNEFEDEPVIRDFTDGFTQQEEEQVELLQEIQETEQIDMKREEDPSFSITEKENHDYILPSFALLKEPIHQSQQREKGNIQKTVKKLERTFHSFGVQAKVTKVHVGPAVTKYEVYPGTGVKVSRIVSLHDDLALALAAKDLRIEAPIPGKSAVGIEVPNQEIAMVSLREVLEDIPDKRSSKLLIGLGRDISGEAVVAELNKMPHLLIAGATGSGKSVCINGVITSILMRAKPHEVKMMMIDPKKVELSIYNGVPHLIAPVVTDPKKASRALKKVIDEMERRYELFSETETRNIEGYNAYVRKQKMGKDDAVLPYIVVIVDELADLMMVASTDVEASITRLAQMARAAGIHLIIATQRPSVDVITGLIKANIPSRIAFSVSSATDSRTILDSGGAEKLLGRGDMLFMPVGASKPVRVQGAFLSDDEVKRVVDHCIEQQKANYQEEMIPEDHDEELTEVDDELYDDAVQLVCDMQSASISMLQRRFRIGYNRAARLIDAMEERGVVGPYEGSKPRTVLINNETEEANV